MQIQFKSTQENWYKEYHGLKRNTLRRIDEDVRFEILDKISKKQLHDVDILIMNVSTEEIFRRKITDVTYYQGFYIISW